MFVAKDVMGFERCAKCGTYDKLTIDHFIPKSCKMTVNEEGNYVKICRECNQEKANQIVLPSWYTYLDENQQNKLCRYMRYARGYILEHTDDEKIIKYVKRL